MTRLDFAFTEHDTPAVRARIERDLTLVASAVRDADPHLVALALTGGFSRGEGTTRHGAPVNDYDLVAFRARAGGDATYARLHESLSREVGIEVDLLPVWTARVPRLGRKLFWLDLRLGGRVIEGDERVFSRIPPMRPADLPRIEVARLLGNRAAGLLLAVPGPDAKPDPLARDLQATKAALAAMDAHLLARGTYAATMRERLALTSGHEDHATFARAVDWKLAEASGEMGDAWWREARDALLRAVDATGARDAGDGVVESFYHALKARRFSLSPSHAVRLEAWRLLARAEFPEGVAFADATWPEVRARFFAARELTLQ